MSALPSESTRATPTVLVIDDEPLVLEVAEAILTRSGYRVLRASDGVRGLALFEHHSSEIDAVLLDRSMPVLDGVAVLRELRRLRVDVPVIFCSGDAGTELSALAIPGPEPLFLRKPYRSSVLLETLARAVPR